MKTDFDLAAAYLELHPQAAARTLEHLAPAAVADFVSALDDDRRLLLFRHLRPGLAAQCLPQLAGDACRDLLRGLGTPAASIILRQLPRTAREPVLQQLGSAQAYAIRHLLAYPDDTVGAWMHTDALAVTPDATTAEILDAVRSQTGDGQHRVYVVDADQHLLGYITVSELLRLPAEQTIARRHHPAPHLLPARALLTQLRQHPAWRGATDLPVIEHDGRFVGMLAHTTLSRALEQQRHAPTQIGIAGLAEAGLTMYWHGMQGLLHGLAAIARSLYTGAEHGR